MAAENGQDVNPGDWIEVHARTQGAPPRKGEILEVLGQPGREHYRVKWDEVHESIFYPADGVATFLMHPHSQVKAERKAKRSSKR